MTQEFSEIEFSRYQQGTALTRNYCLPPLKVINTTSHTHACFCFITNYGAGFVGGDKVALRLTANEDTHSVITTQGNTRVYKSRDNLCSQVIEGILKKNALHVFLNDPIVMHGEGSFSQKATWTLEEGAILLLVDWFSAGRIHNKEAFNFLHYQTETKIIINERPVIWDRFHIDPVHEDVTSPGSFDSNTTYLNIFLVGGQDEPRVKLIESHLNMLNQKYTATGNLNSNDADTPIIGSAIRQNQQAYFSRFTAGDVIHLHKILADLVKIFENKSLLGFNPLKNRYNTSIS